MIVLDDEKRFAVFAYSESTYGEGTEQLTHWSTLSKTKKSKVNWFEKERYTWIMAKIQVEL